MAPAELHLLTERVAALLNRLPGGDKRLEKAIQSLQRINQALVTIACLVDCYGDVFRCEHVVDSVQPMVEHYEALGEREHSRNPLVRRRSSHGEELEGIALLSREIFMSIMQFALRSNTPFINEISTASPLVDLFRQLDDLKINVGALKRASVRGDFRAEALKTHAAKLKDTWECLCDDKNERLCATDMLAPSPSRFLADARWHATQCTHCPILETKPSWDWPTRKRSTLGSTMVTITLGQRRYHLHTYRRSTSMPRTIKWAGMTEPKWVAGKEEEQPGQPIVLEHKLSVQEKDPDLVPFTPHKIHNQDLVVRFPGTQEVVVRDQHDRIIFERTIQPDYCFLDAKYLTQFHQDLRGRKKVICIDVENVSTGASMDHSLKLYLWRDTQSSDIHSHTLSYYSQAEKELVFPLLWFHGTCTRQKPSSKTLLLHFRLPANSSYTKTGHVMEAKDEGHLYVPPKYKALLVKHQSLTVKFENVSDCTSMKETFENAHYEDSLAHLLHCLPLPEPILRHKTLPSEGSSRSTNSLATATSIGSSNIDYLNMSPTWLPAETSLAFPDTLAPIPGPSIPIIGSSAITNEESLMTVNDQPLVLVNETLLQRSSSLPDGHPGNMI